MGLENSDVQEILNIVYTEVSRIITGRAERDILDHEVLESCDFQSQIQEFIKKWQNRGHEGRYRGTSWHIAVDQEIGGNMVDLELAESGNLQKLVDILLDNNTDFPRTVLDDLMIDGVILARSSETFRSAFHAAVSPITVTSGRASVEQPLDSDAIRMSLPAPTINFLGKPHQKEGYANAAIALKGKWDDWNNGKGKTAGKVGRQNTDCFENAGDPRLYHWALANLSSDELKMTPQEREMMIPHMHIYAHDYHLEAARELNSRNHSGSSEYFVQAFIQLAMLQNQIDRLGGGNQNIVAHRKLLQEQMSVLVHCMQDYHLRTDGESPQEYIESTLGGLGMRYENLKPYIAPLLTAESWKELAEKGKKHKGDITRQEREVQEQKERGDRAKIIKSQKLDSEKLEQKKLGVIRIAKREAETTAGWEEPIEYLRAKARNTKAIYYHRNTMRSTTSGISKAEAFEHEFLRDLAKENGITKWLFTEAGKNIAELVKWLSTQGKTTTTYTMKKEIQVWLNSESDGMDLRQHLHEQDLWPRDIHIHEDRITTQQVNYWQALRRTMCDLEGGSIQPAVGLFLGSTSTEESAVAAKLIEKHNGERCIDIGGWAAQYNENGKPFERDDIMAVHHTNMTRDYGSSWYNTEDAFEHATFVAAAGCGYGKTHQTSVVDFGENDRIKRGFLDNQLLKSEVSSLGWSFKMRGNVKDHNVADQVCFTPGGPAGTPADVLEDTDNNREPIFGGGGGWSEGGGGTATM